MDIREKVDRYIFIKRVMDSCTSIEQLDNCLRWGISIIQDNGKTRVLTNLLKDEYNKKLKIFGE